MFIQLLSIKAWKFKPEAEITIIMTLKNHEQGSLFKRINQVLNPMEKKLVGHAFRELIQFKNHQ